MRSCYNEKTALHIACDIGSSNLMVRLLLEYGANPHLCDADHNTPLLIASSQQRNKYDTMKVLLQFGADVNVKDPYGNSPIQKALYYRQDVIIRIKLLLDYGADVNAKNENEITALIWIVDKY